jgi:hypothetical protein
MHNVIAMSFARMLVLNASPTYSSLRPLSTPSSGRPPFASYEGLPMRKPAFHAIE